MIVLGLTGSIGTGKSTTASQFLQLGIPVHDSDAEVHKLLSPGGAGYFHVTAAFQFYLYPQIYNLKTKSIDRRALGRLVFARDADRRRLEGILHPMVRAVQDDFIRRHRRLGAQAVVLDIPLLFETQADKRVDRTIVVTAPHHIQRARVLARPGMDEARFNAINARQMSPQEKTARADFVIYTNMGLAESLRQIKEILRALRAKESHE